MKQTWSFQRWRRRYFRLKGHKLFYAKGPNVSFLLAHRVTRANLRRILFRHVFAITSPESSNMLLSHCSTTTTFSRRAWEREAQVALLRVNNAQLVSCERWVGGNSIADDAFDGWRRSWVFVAVECADESDDPKSMCFVKSSTQLTPLIKATFALNIHQSEA
jgi:hypothetical protein